MSDHGALHATLSPSSAERWLTCPASIRLSASLGRDEDSTNVWAEEGTRAHNLAEIEASYAFGLTTKKEYNTFRAAWLETAMAHGDDIEEMEQHVSTYVAVLRDIMSQMPNATIRLEQRVNTGIEDCWGTGDAILANEDHVHVVDFKYGRGIGVVAEGNPQLRLYGLGALDNVDGVLGDIETVGMTIVQPRTNSVTHAVMTAEDLRDWRESIRPIAEETKREDAHFGPSEVACRWCPAAGVCTARRDRMVALDFGTPEVMSPEELAEVVKMLPEIRDWCAAVEAEALHQAYSEGVVLPGLKVVMSGGKRSIKDVEQAIAVLTAAGFTADQVTRPSLQTLTALEKLVGKQRLPEVLGDLLVKGEGKPALVSDDDARPAIDPVADATRDFQSTD